MLRANASSEAFAGAWNPRFPGQIPDKLVIAEELEGDVIDLEGNELVAVELGHTDTDHTTRLNVPSIGLVVAGDYNDVQLYLVYLAESNAQKRQEWIVALDKIQSIQSLNPCATGASHKRPERDDDLRIIEETRQYLRDFERLETTTTAQELRRGVGARRARLNHRSEPGKAHFRMIPTVHRAHERLRETPNAKNESCASIESWGRSRSRRS